MAVDTFENNDKRAAIPEEKGILTPDILVPFVTGTLPVANIGVVLWRLSRAVAGGRRRSRAVAGALTVPFSGTTSTIHDLWTMERKERHGNDISFLRNLPLLGAALVFFDAASEYDREARSDEE